MKNDIEYPYLCIMTRKKLQANVKTGIIFKDLHVIPPLFSGVLSSYS